MQRTIVLAVGILVLSTSFTASALTLYGPGLPKVNPLIGHWRLTKADTNAATPGAGGGCATEMTFQEETVHQLFRDGSQTTTRVGNYNVGATSVSVMGNAGFVTWDLAGKGQIVHRSGMANCHYSKQ